jgi:hypothetical protein
MVYQFQTFMATKPYSYTIKKVRLKLYRLGNPGKVEVSIREAPTGVPEGGIGTYKDLCSGTLDGNGFTTDPSGAWYTFDMGAGCIVDTGKRYAIVLKPPSWAGGTGNCVYWRSDGSSPTYVYGNNGYGIGGGWSPGSGDNMFEIWGVAPEAFALGPSEQAIGTVLAFAPILFPGLVILANEVAKRT